MKKSRIPRLVEVYQDSICILSEKGRTFSDLMPFYIVVYHVRPPVAIKLTVMMIGWIINGYCPLTHLEARP